MNDVNPETDQTEDNVEAEEVTTDVGATAELTTKVPFSGRAAAMGLIDIGHGTFQYSDEYSQVEYRQLHPINGDGIPEDCIPHLGVFTKKEDDDAWKYIGVVSDQYKFCGNGTIINSIRQSIQEIGHPIVREATMMSFNHTMIRHECVISHETNTPQVGDVFPFIAVYNSYDGKLATNIKFGISFHDTELDRPIMFGSKNVFGNIRQVHLEGSNSEMGSVIGTHIDYISANIADVITENFSNVVEFEEMLKVLDLVERSCGAKRRTGISAILKDITGDDGSQPITSWQIFLAIARFSSVEANINAKTMLENAAERVLVMPTRMAEALDVINA